MFEQTIKINEKEYTFLSLIGQGAVGKVFKAKCQDQLYAIKKQEYFGEGEFEFYVLLSQQKFKKFRNLIQIYDVQKIDRFSYIVMELGESCLYDHLIQNKIDKKNIRFIMQQIAFGIFELTQLNLAHRDLKPENILVQTIKSELTNESQQVFKICDFGFVKNFQNLKTKAVGTPYYIAPELINNTCDIYDKRCDIWSFGQLIYEIVAGKLMFQGSTMFEIQNQILRATDDSISKLVDQLQIDKEYRELLKQMLKVDYKSRCDIKYVLDSLKPNSRSTSRNKQNDSQITFTSQITIRNNFQNQFLNQKQQSPSQENKQVEIKTPLVSKINNNKILPPRPNFMQANHKNVLNFKPLQQQF